MNLTCAHEPAKSVGFVSVYDLPKSGIVGALLVLNHRARPLEFHCTAPIQPNRTQQILYGSTFQSYLYGEEIALALMRKARSPMALVITDIAEVLAARDAWNGPMLLLDNGQDTSPVDGGTSIPRKSFELGSFTCQCLADSDDLSAARRIWQQLSHFDLSEPFGRLRQAVEEAHRGQAA